MLFSRNTARGITSTPDGSRLVIGFGTHVRVMDSSTGKRIGKDMNGHRGLITALAITSDGSRIVAGSVNNTIRVWDMNTRLQIGETMSDPGTDRINSVIVSLDDRLIISGSYDGAIRIWDLNTQTHVRTIGDERWGWNNCIAKSLDGRLFASCHQDGFVRIWSVKTLEMICELCELDYFVLDRSGVKACVFSNDGRNVIAGYHNGDVIIWDILTCAIVRCYELGGFPITKFVLNRSGTRLVVSRYDKIEILNLMNGEIIYQVGVTCANCCIVYKPLSAPRIIYGELNGMMYVAEEDVVANRAMVEGVGRYILPDLARVVGGMTSWGL